MDLELSADQLELRDAARGFLAGACPPSLVREAFEGDADGVADGLWAQLVDLGWPSLGIDERFGGLGQGFVAEAVLVSELGRVVAPSPYLATVTQFAPLLAEVVAAHADGRASSAAGRAATSLLGGVASGAVTGTVRLVEAGRHRTEDVRCTATRTADGWAFEGRSFGLVDPGGRSEGSSILIARLPGTTGRTGVGAFLDVSGSSATGAAIDPTMATEAVQATWTDHPRLPEHLKAADGRNQATVPVDHVLLDPRDPASFDAIERVRLRATVAMAVSCVATCRAIFEQTVDYAKVRHQFGRPIGSFQAVKHRLADLYLAVERADALAWFAVGCVAEDDDRLPVAASMAKAAAGDCQRLATRDGLQLHGGIGFTWEHDLHFWLKRALATSMLCGSPEAHRADLARLLGLAA